jgi:hypothetical protein
MGEQQQAQQPAPLFAVVEIFGHTRIAGAVSEQTFGGSTFVRVDVPEITVTEVDYDAPRGPEGYQRVTRTIPAHTRSFGPGAIYSINWCDEETAKLAAVSIRHEPLKPYSAREAVEALRSTPRLTAPAGDPPGPDDDLYDR